MARSQGERAEECQRDSGAYDHACIGCQSEGSRYTPEHARCRRHHAKVMTVPAGRRRALSVVEAEAGERSSTAEWNKNGIAKPVPAPTTAPTRTSVSQCLSAAILK